jgi:methylmalonyl-CoA mutase N-terminal domain/subunit
MGELGFPGEFPFTRGIQPTMFRGRLWTMRQYAGFGTAAESNERFRYLLAQGVNGLSVAFDLPTQMGYDSDHPMAQGEVGKAGVAIDSIEDMAALFDGIPLDRVSAASARSSRKAGRNRSERHPQGIRGPWYLHLSATRIPPHRHGHLRLL